MTLLFRLLALLALLSASTSALAIDESDLLPVDEAFALTARATAADGIAVDWKIADGYYLYRHRMSAEPAPPATAAGEFELPRGKAHTDEFFGRVETFRGSVRGTLAGLVAGGTTVTLKVKYQGCADLGICYPPQTRTLQVAMPGAAPSNAPGSGGLSALGRALSGKAGAPTLPGTDALPLPPEQAFGFEAITGDGNTLLLRFTPAKGYYLYRDRNSFKLEGANGIATGKPRWPKGVAHRDEYFGDTTVYFDQVDVPLPLVRTRPEAAKATLVATFQGCQTDGICYPPMTRRIAVSLPAGTVAAVPASSPGTPEAAASDPATTVTASPAATAVEDPSTVTADAPASPVEAGAPVATDDTPRTLPPQQRTYGLAMSLLLALLGGLILNLMPCVLPVLSLKALSLAQSGESKQRARRHALAYTAGVLLSFAALGALALALRKAGLALGWGFQLQQPLVVAVLALVIFALGLSLSGLWYANLGVGARSNALLQKQGATGDFFTGVLAVVLATPCTAPFMGAALAYAFTGPAIGGMLVFLMLGLGLALPFLLIGFVPAFARLLPKPGAWMETLKQLLAFPLYATAAWLVWVLAKQRGADAVGLWMAAAVVLALAAWAWSRARSLGGKRWLAVAVVALLALAWPLAKLHRLPAASAANAAVQGNAAHVAFSEQALADLRAQGRVVFVNMTADWCVSCKANERTVFGRDDFSAAMQAANAVYMVGDYTDVDPAITAYLERHKAVGVPLYVVYPRNGGEGEVLPVILTTAIVRDALARAQR